MQNRHLFLIRHAKSSWKNPDVKDHDRGLNKRGLRDAQTMATRLANRNHSIDIIFSSTASRAVGISEAIGNALAVSVNYKKALYTFSDSQLLQCLYQLPNEYRSIAVVAHNPAITAVANMVVQESFDNIPTAGMVAISSHASSWNTINMDNCILDYFDYPKNL